MALGKNKNDKTHSLDTTLRTMNDLIDNGFVDLEKSKSIEELTRRYTIAITPAMVGQIDTPDHDDPVSLQFVPSIKELVIKETELNDPIGDFNHTELKALVHRHKNRVLLKPTLACAVYCRFCFRREMIGPNGDAITQKDVDAALDYIEKNKDIKEVIFTGGDPLILSPQKLSSILVRLENISHVQWIRFHTRIPIVSPEKINQKMLAALKIKKPVIMAIHMNHTKELTNSAQRSLSSLSQQGIILLGQSVLLKGINNSLQALENLFETMIIHHIKPYYLHHPDLTKGTSHFRLSFEEGMQLMRDLGEKLSGICLPHYVVDIPGGVIKVPVTPEYVSPDPKVKGRYWIKDYQGNQHLYDDSQ